MKSKVIITNAHPHGFAFAHATESNEQVFIPIHVAEGFDLSPSDVLEATLVPNYADKSRSGTKFMAVKLYKEGEHEVIHIKDKEHLNEFYENISGSSDLTRSKVDSEVLNLIQAGGYYSTEEIAEQLGLGEKAAGNSAMRLFTAGKIAKAEVYGAIDDKQATFTLWAESASSFIEVA